MLFTWEAERDCGSRLFERKTCSARLVYIPSAVNPIIPNHHSLLPTSRRWMYDCGWGPSQDEIWCVKSTFMSDGQNLPAIVSVRCCLNMSGAVHLSPSPPITFPYPAVITLLWCGLANHIQTRCWCFGRLFLSLCEGHSWASYLMS